MMGPNCLYYVSCKVRSVGTDGSQTGFRLVTDSLNGSIGGHWYFVDQLDKVLGNQIHTDTIVWSPRQDYIGIFFCLHFQRKEYIAVCEKEKLRRFRRKDKQPALSHAERTKIIQLYHIFIGKMMVFAEYLLPT